MNRIAVVSMMKNEADIVESSIRHWALFADKIFIRDHKSTDRTLKILDVLKDEGIPLEISTHDTDEKAQMEVTNKLITKALDENFDLILPLDTDELPILVDGNSKDLREHLQNLDTNHCYRVYCWEYRFGDEDESKYALSRRLLRAPQFKTTYPKIIIGAKFAKKYQVQISYGNHILCVDKKEPNYSVIRDEKIFYAHFAYRSVNQQIAKRVTDYLGTDLQVTRYNCRKEGDSPQQMADRYFGKTPPKLNLDGFFPTDLSAYKNECINKFSEAEGINPGHALFLLASSYVKTLVRERILSKKEIVRVFLLFDGDVERSIQSLNSIFEQTYPYKKIFVAILTSENVGELIVAMKDRVSQVEFVNKSELKSKLESPDGSYIQFVVPGDRLMKNKLMHQVELEHSEHVPQISICRMKSVDEKNLPIEFDPPREICGFPWKGNWLVWGILGNNAVRYLTENAHLIRSGISRAFFRQEIFKNVFWLQGWIDNIKNFCIESNSIYFLAQMMINRKIYFLDEDLVERGCRDWTEVDLGRHRYFCQFIQSQIMR